MPYETQDFAADVLGRSHRIPVLVDFWASWCAPCRALGPVLERLAEKYKESWALVKLNTEEFPAIAARYNVRSIPNVKLFVDGEAIDEFSGALPEEMIEHWLKKALPSQYQKKINQAEQYFSEGRITEAQTLLEEVMAAEPGNHRAAVLLARSYLFSDYQKALAMVGPIKEDSDYFDSADAIRTIGRLFKYAQAPETLPENAVKERYLKAIRNFQRGDFDNALTEFIEIIKADRAYDADGVRRACIALFKYLGEEHEITRKKRKAFSSALYV